MSTPLSDEDRRRIEAEERYRAEVRRAMEPQPIPQAPKVVWNCLKCGYSAALATQDRACPKCGNRLLEFSADAFKSQPAGCSGLVIVLVLALAGLGLVFPPLLVLALVIGILAVVVKVLSR